MRSIYRLLMVLLIFIACKRQDLVYDYESTTKVIVNVDWDDILTQEEKPTGVSVWFYPKDGGRKIEKLSTNIESVQVYLPVGEYDVVVFNQSQSDLRDDIDFIGIDKLSTLEVRASQAPTKSWYPTKVNDQAHVCPPFFATVVYRDLIVTEQDADMKRDLIIRVVPKKVTKSARIIVRMSGMDYVRSARGLVSNMSQGYVIGKDEFATTSSSLLENWNTGGEISVQNDGGMFVRFNTFGLSDGEDSKAWDAQLQLQILLVDNKTIKDLNLPVDESHLVDIDKDIDIEIDINTIDEIPPVNPEGGSGFEPSVDDWGDEDNVEI